MSAQRWVGYDPYYQHTAGYASRWHHPTPYVPFSSPSFSDASAAKQQNVSDTSSGLLLSSNGNASHVPHPSHSGLYTLYHAAMASSTQSGLYHYQPDTHPQPPPYYYHHFNSAYNMPMSSYTNPPTPADPTSPVSPQPTQPESAYVQQQVSSSGRLDEPDQHLQHVGMLQPACLTTTLCAVVRGGIFTWSSHSRHRHPDSLCVCMWCIILNQHLGCGI